MTANSREPNRDDAEWISRLSHKFRKRLANVGLIKLTKAETIPTVANWVERYLKSRTDIKPRTKDILQSAIKSLIEFWGREKILTEFTELDAMNFRVFLLEKGLADATVRSRCRKAKQFFAAAKRKRLITENPFDAVPTADRIDKSRQCYIDDETIQAVIEVCPNAEWRLIVALARYAGLRMPSELFGLTWDDILWDKKRFIVHSPKTEHIEGKDQRTVPLFPNLEPFFVEVFEQAMPGQQKVITIYDKKNQNLRTQFHRIIKKAGLKPWPKPFQNLRSSCETDLVESFPIHVVTAWLGNSPEIAKKHYLQVTDEHFDRAVEVAQNPAQQLHENTRNGSQEDFIESIKKSVSPEVFEALRIVASSCVSVKTYKTPRTQPVLTHAFEIILNTRFRTC